MLWLLLLTSSRQSPVLVAGGHKSPTTTTCSLSTWASLRRLGLVRSPAGPQLGWPMLRRRNWSAAPLGQLPARTQRLS